MDKNNDTSTGTDNYKESFLQYQKDKDIFLNYKKEIIQEFGDGALSTEDCNSVGKKQLKSNWGGCLPWDKVKIKPNTYYIVNTSSAGNSGIHWMGLVTTDSTAYLWDSYNRSVKKLVPGLIRLIKKSGFKLGVSDHPMEQIGTTSQVCGHESLSWLLLVRDVGIQRAVLV
jgi:hypothetical protein